MSYPARHLVQHATTNPFLYDEIRRHVTNRTVMRLVDHILADGVYPTEICRLIQAFQLDLLTVLAPGLVLHHFYCGRRPSILELLQTVFGMEYSSGALVQIDDITDPIGDLLRAFLTLADIRSRPLLLTARTYPTLGLYSVDAQRLSRSCYSSGKRVTEFLIEQLAETDATLTALRQPAVLATLARVGIRFEFLTYLAKVPVSVDELRDVVPYLSPWGTYIAGVKYDLAERRTPVIVAFAALHDYWERFATDFRDAIFLTLCHTLQMRDWATFRRLSRRSNLNSMVMQKHYLQGRTTLLHEAVKCNAPRGILDMLLCCPNIDVTIRDRNQHTPLQYASDQQREYIQAVLDALQAMRNRDTESPSSKRVKLSPPRS